MSRALAAGLFMAALVSVPAYGIVNPHYAEESCGSCHRNLPEVGPDGEIDYSFLGGEIDRTCNICHEDACCNISGPHLSTHPSGVDRWDKEKYGTPEHLPLADGFITCVSCHFWRRDNNPLPTGYKLLRIVKVGTTGRDWTGLCKDCHRDY